MVLIPWYFVLDIRNKTEFRRNPYHQARDYLDYWIDKIKENGKLVSYDSCYDEYLISP
jgi:hypothetical protein